MLIKVKVKTKQKKYQIMQKSTDSFLINVKEKPEAGQANNAVLQLLAQHFNIHLNKVRIIKGTKQPNKIIEIRQ